MPVEIREAVSEQDVERCFPAMHDLRPHVTRDSFAAQVRRQRETQGYRLAFVESDGEVTAVAGFRVIEMLAWGRSLYVDDLITAEAHRGDRHGSRLFDWLVEEARRCGCSQFHLDSGVQRHGAHRFYLHKGLDITSYHFAMKL